MYVIRKASTEDAKLLAELAIKSFLPAHGHAAPKKDIEDLISKNFSVQNLTKELQEINSEFYLIISNNKMVGYSKLMFNKSENDFQVENTTYLSRFYILKEYYGKGLGKELFEHNIKTCKSRKQKGIWLKVWIENEKAIKFYKKMGFKIVGATDYWVSETYSNPNHIMYLQF